MSNCFKKYWQKSVNVLRTVFQFYTIEDGRLFLFLILTVFFVSFFTSPFYFYIPVAEEKSGYLIYQKGDGELLNENYLTTNYIDAKILISRPKEFSQSTILGIPLNWLHHVSCFSWKVTLTGSGGSSIHGEPPMVLVIQKNYPNIMRKLPFSNSPQCINTDEFDSYSLGTLNKDEPQYIQYIEKYKDNILRNCKPNPNKLDQCTIPFRLSFSTQTSVNGIPAFVGAYFLAMTLSVLFLTIIIPKILKFIRLGFDDF